MRQIIIKFNINGLDMNQRLVIYDDNISEDKLIKGFEKGDYITTVGHDKSKLGVSEDVEVLDKELNKIGYVKEQWPEDYLVIKNFKLISSVDI